MRFNELLLEYNVEYTKRTFGDELVKRYSTSPDKPLNYLNYSKDTILDEILKNLEKADPTPNHKYMPWIVREYINGNLKRFEDISGLKLDLEKYHKNKNSSEFIRFANTNSSFGSAYNKDVKNIFNLSLVQLRELMRLYFPSKNIVDKGKSVEVYKDKTVRVIQPLDEQAACYYGQGTQWCTAATESENYFSDYVQPLYILLPTYPKYKGEKFQLHIPTNQFSNEKDEMLPLERLVFRFPKFVEYLKTNSSEADTRMLNYFLATADENIVLEIWKILVTELLKTTGLILRNKNLPRAGHEIVPLKQKIISDLKKLNNYTRLDIINTTLTSPYFHDVMEGSEQYYWLTLTELKEVLMTALHDLNTIHWISVELKDYIEYHISISDSMRGVRDKNMRTIGLVGPVVISRL